MRIRKQAKLAGLSLTACSPSSGCSADPTPHGGSSYRFHCPRPICQLNQSPWDVLSFPPDSPSSPFQVDGEVGSNYTANGSSANSLGAVESVASMRIPTDSNNGIGLGFENGGTISCCKTFAECKMETSKGHSDHQLRAYDSLTTTAYTCTAAKKLEKPLAAAPIRRRGRPRKLVQAAPPPPPAAVVNPYEFYYYSGFGPRWGRKRRGSHLAKSKNVEEEEDSINLIRGRVPDSSVLLLSSSEIDSDEFDYVHEDKQEEEENSNAGVKKVIRRGRKKIKARSLKSLM